MVGFAATERFVRDVVGCESEYRSACGDVVPRAACGDCCERVVVVDGDVFVPNRTSL